MKEMHFTAREKEVLKEICSAYTTKEIAAKLKVSTGTIETHKRNLIQKCNARNTLDLAVMTVKNGWI